MHTTYSRLCSPLLYPTHLVSVSLRISTPVRVINQEADTLCSFLLVSSVQMEIRSIDTSTFPLSSTLCSRSDFGFFDSDPCVCVCALFLLPALLCVPRLVRSLGPHPPTATLYACVFDFAPCSSYCHFVSTKRTVNFA